MVSHHSHPTTSPFLLLLLLPLPSTIIHFTPFFSDHPKDNYHNPHLSFPNSSHFPFPPPPWISFPWKSIFLHFFGKAIQELLADVEREKQKEREERKRAGLDTADIDAEDDEDYMGVGPIIEKLEKEKLKDTDTNLHLYEEPTDSDTDDDDERFTTDSIKKRSDEFEKKFKRHEELLKNFTDAEALDDAFKWMNKIDKFEQKHFRLRPEYLVIGELINRLKEATGKDKFLLQHKLNRAIRLVEWKEAYDPNNPANYGVIQHEQLGPSVDLLEHAGFEKEKQIIQGAGLDEDDEEEFNDMKEKDDILLEKLNAIDKKLEEKLAQLDHTLGRKESFLRRR
ncbi:unnamed protein product [Ilex paraguariensis]|uniref:Uncharacterized protein n=1 Tax=Ilex paraguariensis TaxID=185542 RepID=A0ABC8TRN0_9AQUA